MEDERDCFCDDRARPPRTGRSDDEQIGYGSSNRRVLHYTGTDIEMTGGAPDPALDPLTVVALGQATDGVESIANEAPGER